MTSQTTIQSVRSILNPFRPGSGLFPACLAGRSLDVDLFSHKLYSTITGTPKNIIVYGDRKMGKTSLLMRMEKIAEEKKLLTVSTIASPMDNQEFFTTMAIRLFVEVKNRGMALEAFEAVMERFHGAPQNSIQEIEIAFTDFLLSVWDLIKEKVPALIFSVDDLDFICPQDQALRILQNVTKTLYRHDCPTVFAVTTSTKFFDEIQKKREDLTHYFEPIRVHKLQMSSLINAIRVPLWDLNISFDESVIREIARRSDGFPFYLQAIAHHIFEESDGEFDTLALRRGYAKAMLVLERDIFLPLYAGLTPTEAKIYLEIYMSKKSSFTQLLKALKIPRGSVASSLKRLREKQMIEQDKKMYSVTDSLFGSYLERKLKEERLKNNQ